jgi:hypothetical protein
MTTAATEQQDWDLIPPAVRAKMEEMAKFTAPDPNAAAEEGVQPPVAGEPATPEPAPAPVTPLEPKKEEAAPAPAQATDEPQTFQDLATEEMTKEQRYKRMEGLHKAIGRDLSRSQRDTQALQAEVEALKAQLASRATAPAAVPAAAPAELSTEDAELLEALGEKNVQGLEKRMERYLKARGFVVTQDLQPLEQRVGKVSQSVETSTYTVFENDMDAFTDGKWKQLNVDPAFIAYTQEFEGRTRTPRIEIMRDALARRDAAMLAPFFTDFEAEQSAAPAATAPVVKPKLDKKALAAPKATPAATVLPEGEKPTVKMSEWTQFSADVRAGKFVSDDPVQHKQLQDKMRLEQARLDEAQRSGRLIPG